MVKKDDKLNQLENALDKTLDKFLHRVRTEDKEEEGGKELSITLSEGNYPLTPEEERYIREISAEKGCEPDELLQKAIGEFIQRERVPVQKEQIKTELLFWQNRLEGAQKNLGETDLERKEIRVLLGYFRELARGSWEEK